MEPAPPAKDPRNRPFRLMAWAVYLFFTVGFSLLVTIGVIRGVLAMTPGRPQEGAPLDARACGVAAAAMFDELEQRRLSLAAAASPSRADADWVSFRNGWATRLRELEARCAGEGSERVAVQRALAELDQVGSLYSVHVTQFSQELGPAIERLRLELAAVAR